jgi:uncharacterized NAD(P)/FAD-binding protein YdhS
MVIGGGASGLLAAVQMLRQASTEKVILFEQGELGAGIAYGTEHPGHLLNVRAERMSAFPDQPSHFLDWLEDVERWRPADGWTGQSYAPRRLYRDYLQSLIAPYLRDRRFAWVRSTVATIVQTDNAIIASTADGARHSAEAAVLATGNEGPTLPPAPWRHIGWSNSPLPDLPADAPVAIIGTGLSMVDAVISLLDGGHRGTITAISRRGLLPRAHGSIPPEELDLGPVPANGSLNQGLRWFRQAIRKAEARGGDWRSAVDALRPHTQALWQGLSHNDQGRFLRHLRPWWDVHRHRMAPQIAERIACAQASGQLRIIKARINSVEGDDQGASLSITPRGTTSVQSLDVRLVVECRGASGDLARTRNPLLADMRDAGLIRADPLRLGLDVDAGGATIRSDGTVSNCLFAVGPITAGRFWEIVAIPDIRVQVARMADHLSAR